MPPPSRLRSGTGFVDSALRRRVCRERLYASPSPEVALRAAGYIPARNRLSRTATRIGTLSFKQEPRRSCPSGRLLIDGARPHQQQQAIKVYTLIELKGVAHSPLLHTQCDAQAFLHLVYLGGGQTTYQGVELGAIQRRHLVA